MTRKEAIQHLKNMADHSYPNEEYLMAIQALQALQEPTGDLISRQAVIDAIDKWVKNMGVLIALPANEATPLFEAIHNLPSAEKTVICPSVGIDCEDCPARLVEEGR